MIIKAIHDLVLSSWGMEIVVASTVEPEVHPASVLSGRK